MQEKINRAREQNAQRKMAKVQGREWDAGKKGAVDWKEQAQAQAQQAAPSARAAGDDQPTSPVSPRGGRGGGRGLPRGGRGRGRGRGGPPSAPRTPDAPAIPVTAAEDPATKPPTSDVPELPSAPIGEAL